MIDKEEAAKILRKLDPKWTEEDRHFRAGVVLLVALYCDRRTPEALALYSTYPLTEVREYVERAKKNGLFCPEGIAAEWDNPEGGCVAFIMDTMICTGLVERYHDRR